VGEADGPPATEERILLCADEVGVELLGDRPLRVGDSGIQVFTERRAEERECGGRETRLHDGTFVRERKGDGVVDQVDEGRGGITDDPDRAHSTP
jgi:hypothetical protein